MDVGVQRQDFRRPLLLERRGVERVFEIREHGECYQLDLALAEFRYGPGLEGYWFDETDDWVVYCSHEHSLTLAGSIAEVAIHV